MKIAILSGKGGTGKTTISASLAVVAKDSQYIDCDVEEPNGYIFLNPEISSVSDVKVQIPQVDVEKCTACGNCKEACQFSAIAVIKENVLIFPEMCHHCEACYMVCPTGALSEKDRTVGVVEGNEDGSFLQGKLNIGEMITIPVIKELKRRMQKKGTTILDCSPGAACTVVESVEGSDFCILVTEPTPFGLHDLNIAVTLIRKMNIPFGIVLNKASEDSRIIHEYCEKENIDILMELPYSRDIAECYSKGILPAKNEKYRKQFIELLDELERRVGK